MVIGGAGGIGEAWSEFMIRHYQANIVWLGRKPENDEIRQKIARLAALGMAPLYVSADATNIGALQKALKTIKAKFGDVHGVIHSAIVLLDQSITIMEEDNFKLALAAKVDVSVRMAQVFRDEPLDMVVFFSSLVSFTKPAGQSNYASGCTFKDAYAHQLSRLWSCQVRVMNWGYWGSVGIATSDDLKKRMAKFKIASIEPPEAMDALDSLLSNPMLQMGFLKTDRRFADKENQEGREILESYPAVYPSVIQELHHEVPSLLEAHRQTLNSFSAEASKSDGLNQCLQAELREIAGVILGVDQEDFHVHAQWKDYGFDQYTLNDFRQALMDAYQLELPFDLLSRNATLSQLVRYFGENHQDLVEKAVWRPG